AGNAVLRQEQGRDAAAGDTLLIVVALVQRRGRSRPDMRSAGPAAELDEPVLRPFRGVEPDRRMRDVETIAELRERDGILDRPDCGATVAGERQDASERVDDVGPTL